MVSTSKYPDKYSIPEIELSYRYPVNQTKLPKITTAQQAYKALMSTWDLRRIELVEQFKVILINQSNRLLGIYEVSTGGTNATFVDAKLIFAAAVKSAAAAMVLAHNHPSGSIKPSVKDIQLTRRIKYGAAILGIEVIDHLVITKEGYLSMSEQGIL